MTALIAALLTGALFHFSTGLNDVWPLAWLAPLPVLWLAYGGERGWKTAAAAFAGYLLGQLNLFEAYALLGLPLFVMVAIISAVFALCVMFGRFAARRLPPLAAALAFPCAWTAWEFLFSLISPHGSFGALAYSQVSAPVLIQGAAVFGLWWVSFLICAVASLVALALRRPDRQVALLSAATLLFLFNLGFGALWMTRGTETAVRVAGVADDRLGKFAWTADRTNAVTAATGYAAQARRLALGGAAFVVLPEKFAYLKPEYRAEALAPLQAVADDTGATLIAGFDDKGTRTNEALVLRPHMAPFAYAKRHMIPGLESGYRPGPGAGLFAPGLSVAICKDMDFPQTLRADARGGIKMLFVPAWDFDRDGWAHARMAVMRGVEGGYAVVRSAQHGLVTVSDSHGRVMKAPSDGRGLSSAVSPGEGGTPYLRIGDLFGWLCAAGAAILLIAGLMRRPLALTSGPSSV